LLLPCGELIHACLARQTLNDLLGTHATDCPLAANVLPPAAYPQQRLGSEGTVHEAIEVLDAAKKLGLTVMRTWAFNDGAGWNAFQPQPGKDTLAATPLQALDIIVWGCSLYWMYCCSTCPACCTGCGTAQNSMSFNTALVSVSVKCRLAHLGVHQSVVSIRILQTSGQQAAVCSWRLRNILGQLLQLHTSRLLTWLLLTAACCHH
jgi:hypothetical protein